MSANVAQSVRDRLRTRARRTGEVYEFLLVRFAAERFLYRLSQSSQRGRFVLKGASLFAVWNTQPYRATRDRDLDLEGFGPSDAASVVAAFREVCAAGVEDDGVALFPDAITADTLRAEEEYRGVRVAIPARIGDARADIQIDVGFGDVITPPAQETEYPTLLPFPAPRLRVYPRETVIAEKWEAMVSLGIANTRLKDFADVWILARDFAFDGVLLAAAIHATFTRRGTALPGAPPAALTSAFAKDTNKQQQWEAFVRRGAVIGVPTTFAAIVHGVAPFLMPPTQALAAGKPFAGQWGLGGPWRPVEDTDEAEGP